MSDFFKSSEFIANPTKLSLFIKDLAKQAERQQIDRFCGKNFWQRNVKKIQLIIHVQNYRPIYNFIINFDKPKLTGLTWENIKILISKLEEIFTQISLNNIFLSYWLNISKDSSCKIMTKEEEKIKILKDYSGGRVSLEKLKSKIGFLALNPFELSSPRYLELTAAEIKILAQNASKFKIHPRPELKEYLGRDLVSRYIAMREELKWLAMQIVADLRINFLKIAKTLVAKKIIKKQNDIFNLSFQKIKKLHNEIQL